MNCRVHTVLFAYNAVPNLLVVSGHRPTPETFIQDFSLAGEAGIGGKDRVRPDSSQSVPDDLLLSITSA